MAENLFFGGSTHAPDPASWRQRSPLCGTRTKATPRSTAGQVTCIRCLKLLGLPIPASAHKPRVVWAGAIGWTCAAPGRYTAEFPGEDGKYRAWQLVKRPRMGLWAAGWYLSSPGALSEELMSTADWDKRLPAALAAATAFIMDLPRPKGAS